MKNIPPTLYLFGGSNGAGKTTFARAYLRLVDPIPRFLNADELFDSANSTLQQVDGFLSQ